MDLTEPLESKSGVLVLTEMQPEAAAGVSLPPKIREEKKKTPASSQLFPKH